MIQKEFTALPELLTRAKVVECGVPAGSVDDMREMEWKMKVWWI